MYVIAFASQKGGSGKTTLAGHIAVEAERTGLGPVVLMDTDPQGSLSQWWNVREAETPAFVRTTANGLASDLAALRGAGTGLVVIDTPPAITSTIGKVIAEADLVVIPTRPSPHDLRAAGATVQICEDVDKPLVFAINGASPRARITTEAAIALSHHGAVSPAIVHQRIDFASAMIDGRTVMELGGSSRSPGEIAELWAFLRNRLTGETASPLLSTSETKTTKEPLSPMSDGSSLRGAA